MAEFFDRFTSPARRVVVLAQEEARTLKHNYIGSEHILLGILREQESLAARALSSMGISYEMVLSCVRELIGEGSEEVSGLIFFNPSTKRLMDQTRRVANLQNSPHIEPEHLLLGLLNSAEEGGDSDVAVQVIGRLGVIPVSIREEVLGLISGIPAKLAPTPDADTKESVDPTVVAVFPGYWKGSSQVSSMSIIARRGHSVAGIKVLVRKPDGEEIWGEFLSL